MCEILLGIEEGARSRLAAFARYTSVRLARVLTISSVY